MSEEPNLSKAKPVEPAKPAEPQLPASWQQIQSAVWLIGLAILAWQDWWWPGILVLVALSGLVQAGIQMYLAKQVKAEQSVVEARGLTAERTEWLPSICPNCGAPT